VYNPQDDELLEYLKANDVFCFVGQLNGETNMATQRFLEYTQMLNSEYAEDVDYVITTDIRDVIFQKDPGVWVQNNIQDFDLIATSEGVTFRHEDWNGDNLEKHFGRNMFLKLADKETICSGIIAGKKQMMIELFKSVYDLAFFSSDPGAFVDQIFYAIAIYEIFYEKTKIVPASQDWVANLGTLKAIPENTPTWSTASRSHYSSYERIRKNKTFTEVMKCKVPEMVDGMVIADNGNPFTIVHQYDRYQPWKEFFLGEEKKTTIVTALYDLKRESWDGFNRDFTQYKNWMKDMLSFDAPMIVYVDETDREFVESYRKNKETKVIVTPFKELQTYKEFGYVIKKVMGSEEFLKDQTAPTHPQIKHPEYNILMHEKIQFVKRSIQDNPFGTDHFMWLDAGVFHMSQRADLLNKKFPLKNITNNKVNFICIEEPKLEDIQDLEKFYKGHNVKIIGTSWGGHKDAILEFEKTYTDLLKESVSNNLMDQDQSFLTVSYLRNPEICNVYKGAWTDAINMWA
jgi:protein YibB